VGRGILGHRRDRFPLPFPLSPIPPLSFFFFFIFLSFPPTHAACKRQGHADVQESIPGWGMPLSLFSFSGISSLPLPPSVFEQRKRSRRSPFPSEKPPPPFPFPSLSQAEDAAEGSLSVIAFLLSLPPLPLFFSLDTGETVRLFAPFLPFFFLFFPLFCRDARDGERCRDARWSLPFLLPLFLFPPPPSFPFLHRREMMDRRSRRRREEKPLFFSPLPPSSRNILSSFSSLRHAEEKNDYRDRWPKKSSFPSLPPFYVLPFLPGCRVEIKQPTGKIMVPLTLFPPRFLFFPSRRRKEAPPLLHGQEGTLRRGRSGKGSRRKHSPPPFSRSFSPLPDTEVEGEGKCVICGLRSDPLFSSFFFRSFFCHQPPDKDIPGDL